MTYLFNAGPAILPKDVLLKAQDELMDYRGLGYSIMEASHRSDEFKAVAQAAEASLRDLLSIPDSYAVLFLQGGASSQFFMVPMNLLGDGQCADYIDTGAWSTKAYKEAAKLGKAQIIAGSADSNYNYIPDLDRLALSDNAAYLHVTSNNTIFGTQYQHFPKTAKDIPLVADMSSDILSRPLKIEDFGVIYAGAQKNIGPAGVTLVILRKDLAARAPAELPTMLNYNTHISKESMFNTPPTFGIYMIKLVAERLQQKGGLKVMEEVNRKKAALLYDEIDADDFYTGTAATDSRSQMNVTFNLETPELEAQFVQEARAGGLAGLKGHRSIGGVRASIYNAMPVAGVEALVSFMQDFRKANS